MLRQQVYKQQPTGEYLPGRGVTAPPSSSPEELLSPLCPPLSSLAAGLRGRRGLWARPPPAALRLAPSPPLLPAGAVAPAVAAGAPSSPPARGAPSSTEKSSCCWVGGRGPNREPRDAAGPARWPAAKESSRWPPSNAGEATSGVSAAGSARRRVGKQQCAAVWSHNSRCSHDRLLAPGPQVITRASALHCARWAPAAKHCRIAAVETEIDPVPGTWQCRRGGGEMRPRWQKCGRCTQHSASAARQQGTASSPGTAGGREAPPRRRRRFRRRRHQPASDIESAVSGGTQLNDIGSYWGCCPEGNSSCFVQQTSPVRWCMAQTGVHQCRILPGTS
jgi:hypothetical protein